MIETWNCNVVNVITPSPLMLEVLIIENLFVLLSLISAQNVLRGLHNYKNGGSATSLVKRKYSENKTLHTDKKGSVNL